MSKNNWLKSPSTLSPQQFFYGLLQGDSFLAVLCSYVCAFLCDVCSVTACFWPRGYKTFFMLNSAEHEIFSANKYENANNSWHFHIY